VDAVAGGVGRGVDPERASDRRRETLRGLVGLGVGDRLLDPSQKLSPGELGVVRVDDLELPPDDLAEGPIGEAGPVSGQCPTRKAGFSGRPLI